MKRLNYAAEQLGPHKISCSTRHSNVHAKSILYLDNTFFLFLFQVCFCCHSKRGFVVIRRDQSDLPGYARPTQLKDWIRSLRLESKAPAPGDLEPASDIVSRHSSRPRKSHSTWFFLCIQNQFKPETGLHRSISVCFNFLRSKTSKTCGFFMAKSTRAI